ncbi:MAG: cell division protein SepF [Acidaminococcus sp.]|jgi:cell division inhibitor SepF|nr:cell division protein SepF [Acidaminococcus sp.]MCI2115982.1 cell division protein SepF [Acidaminococcus sp.]
MNFIKRLLAKLGIGDDMEDYEDEEMETEQGDNVVSMFGAKTWDERDARGSRRDSFLFGRKKEREEDKLISMPLSHNQVSVVVVEPINFDEVQKMADYLRKNQPVVINFEDTDTDVRKRIVDFMSGTIYAIDGTMKKIGRNIMVCAPQNVDIDVENTNYTKEGGAAPWEN